MKLKQILSSWFKGQQTSAPAERTKKDDPADSVSSAASSDFLARQVATLIAASEIPEAMQVLLDAGYTDAAALKYRWDELMRSRDAHPNPDWESFAISQNRIIYALLDLTNPAKLRAGVPTENPPQEPATPSASKLSATQRQQLRDLLDQDQWQQALELGKTWDNELMLLHTQQQLLEKNNRLGLVTEATYQQTLRRVMHALQHLVG